jgi:hypothetical protein
MYVVIIEYIYIYLYKQVQKHVLPTKSVDDIQKHFKRRIRRDAPDNPIKSWKLKHNNLTEEESELLHKGVQYFGTRFDLIVENLLTGRTEDELKKAYAKFKAQASKQVL